MNEYATIAGTAPDADEQHEPRTLTRERQEGLYMMTEIGDGTFVQWADCDKCKRRVDECKCAGGPVEPGYINRWRVNRFAESFQGRGVEPALPVVLRHRDRRVNAVIRFLTKLGYDIKAPAERPEEDPAFVEDEHDGTGDPHEYLPKREPEADETAERVESGMDSALAAVQAAQAERELPDAGF